MQSASLSSRDLSRRLGRSHLSLCGALHLHKKLYSGQDNTRTLERGKTELCAGNKVLEINKVTSAIMDINYPTLLKLAFMISRTKSAKSNQNTVKIATRRSTNISHIHISLYRHVRIFGYCIK